MILILDDHPLSRQGLCSIIQLHRKDETILQSGTVKDAITLMENNLVDLAFVDINLGGEDGFSFLNWVRERKYKTKIFIITSSSRQSDFKCAQDLGVDAYVLKDAFIDEIVFGLKAVERGGKFYSSAIVEQLNQSSEDEIALSTLTEREIEVLKLLGEGYNNSKISAMLFIAEGTTKKHINNILNKLQLQTRIEAALLANKNGYYLQMVLSKTIKHDLRKKGG